MKLPNIFLNDYYFHLQVGKYDREDITSTYKYPEKSRDERDTMLKALKQANSAFSRSFLDL